MALKAPTLRTPTAPRASVSIPALRKPTLRAKQEPLPPNPLDPASLPKDLEGENIEELKRIRKALTDARLKERARYDTMYDAGYYFTVVFETGAQAAAFLKGIGYNRSEHDGYIVDGARLASILNVPLPKAEGVIYNTGGPSSWSGLVKKGG